MQFAIFFFASSKFFYFYANKAFSLKTSYLKVPNKICKKGFKGEAKIAIDEKFNDNYINDCPFSYLL